MATKATPIQFLRSLVFNKRPEADKMLPGQPAVNTNPSQPGLFFADDTGNSLFKVGPCTVSNTPPNDGATTPGQLGNSVGETWLDTTVTPLQPGPVLKIWDGTQWIGAMPFLFAGALMTSTTPSTIAFPYGTMWWNTDTGLLYILYNDGTTPQWVQISASVVA
jgi:hypothetical protein